MRIEGASHTVQSDQPVALVKVVREFLDSLATTRASEVRVSWWRASPGARKGDGAMSKKGGNKTKAPDKKPVMVNKGPKKK